MQFIAFRVQFDSGTLFTKRLRHSFPSGSLDHGDCKYSIDKSQNPLELVLDWIQLNYENNIVSLINKLWTHGDEYVIFERFFFRCKNCVFFRNLEHLNNFERARQSMERRRTTIIECVFLCFISFLSYLFIRSFVCVIFISRLNKHIKSN